MKNNVIKMHFLGGSFSYTEKSITFAVLLGNSNYLTVSIGINFKVKIKGN